MNITKIFSYFLIVLIFTSFSFITNAKISENQPPTDPIIDGPSHCQVGINYEWTFVSTDPEEDNITYYVDWGDECGGAEYYGPYPSGEEIVLAHKYTFSDTLIINAIAIDTQGAESGKTYFEVVIPKCQFLNKKVFNFYNLFINLFPIFIILILNFQA